MIVESYGDVIVLSGALRSNFWETIHTAISLTLKRHPSGVIVDCSGITECTPAGADTFVDAMHFIERQEARIIVAAVPDQVLEVLKSVPEVRSQLAIAASVEDARRSLDLLEAGADIRKPKRKPATSVGMRRILVCLSGEKSDDHLVDVAREIAGPHQSEIRLVFPMLVPRELPLQSPLPELEEEAKYALRRAEAALIEASVPNTIRLERARDVGSAIHEAIQDDAASQVLVALPNDADALDNAVKLVKAVLSKVETPVMFVRAATD